MVRITEMPAIGRGFIEDLKPFEVRQTGWTEPVPAGERRVAIVSSAAVSRRGDKPFSWLARDHRVIGKRDRDLVMTHVAVEYDRTAWQQDLNAIIPLDRLEEMASDGEIGSDHPASEPERRLRNRRFSISDRSFLRRSSSA